MADRTSKPTDPIKTYKQPEPKSQVQCETNSKERTSTDTTRITLPTYKSLASDTPPIYAHRPSGQPTYTYQSNRKPTTQEPAAGASAATLRAIMGDPVPEEPRRSFRDRLLCRRQTYNRRPPSSEREQGSSARWNVWGSPISDAHK
jgi:hypothetical protein